MAENEPQNSTSALWVSAPLRMRAQVMFGFAILDMFLVKEIIILDRLEKSCPIIIMG